jgi:hypothetical protein
MKTLKDYSNKLLTGKHINEGLFVKSKPINQHQVEFKMPKLIFDEIHLDKIANIVLPKHQYFIYNDAYRGLPHLASMDDMLLTIGSTWENDFEDLDPHKIVIYSSNSHKEILKWYFEEFFNVPVPKKNEDIEEYIDKHEYKFYKNGKRKVCDEIYKLCEFYLGEDIIPVHSDFDMNDENAVIKLFKEFYSVAK